MLTLTPTQERRFFQAFFPNFKNYYVPFNIDKAGLFRAAVETWGRSDHLLLLLHQEHYKPTISRYTAETVNRKFNAYETIKHFYPSASDDQADLIILEHLQKAQRKGTPNG